MPAVRRVSAMTGGKKRRKSRRKSSKRKSSKRKSRRSRRSKCKGGSRK